MSSWAAQHWQAPELSETLQPNRVILDLPMVNMLPDGVLDELRERFGAEFDALGADEAEALITARLEGQITNERLQGMLTRHRVDITAMLRELVHHKLLVPEDVDRGTRYTLGAGSSVVTSRIWGGTPRI